MFTLRLFIMGLVALVPENGGFTLVLPNASQEHEAHQHFAVLICDPYQATCNLSGGRNQWRNIRDKLKLHVGSYGKGFNLRGEEIAIHGALPGELQPAKGDWYRKWWWDDFWGARPGNLQIADDMPWVPVLRHADEDAAVIDPDHLQRPSKDFIAALQVLRGVAAESYSYRFPLIRSPRRPFVRSLTFKRKEASTPIKTLRHAGPDVLLVEIPFTGPSIRLELRRFSDLAPTRTMSLAPKSGRRIVDVLLGNLAPLSTKDEPEKVGDPLKHFELFYELSQHSIEPGEQKIPHIGQRKVNALKINRPIPSVIRLVSRGKGGEGGVERPVCTFTAFQKSPGLASGVDQVRALTISRNAAQQVEEEREAPQAALPAELEPFFIDGEGREFSYRAKSTSKRWTFTALEDQVVITWSGSRPLDIPSDLQASVFQVFESPGADLKAEQADEPKPTHWQAAVVHPEVLAQLVARDAIGAPPPLPDLALLPVFLDNEGNVRYFVPLIRVWLEPDVSEDRADQTIREAIRVDASVLRSGIRGYYTVKVAPRDLFEAINNLTRREARGVAIAEPGELGLGSIPTQAHSPQGCTRWGRDKIHAAKAKDQGAEGEGVIVAIIDTGVDRDHPDLKGRVLWPAPGQDWDFSDFAETLPNDRVGHGTHVAGIIADVAKKSLILPLRVDLGSASDDDYVRAIQYVNELAQGASDNNRYVLNMSWTLGADKEVVREELKKLQVTSAKGVVAVAAAGNGSSDLQDSPEYPALYAEVIAVAATQDDDVKTIDSSYGEAISASAPGWGILSAWIPGKDKKERCGDGTSIAAAHVSALAALVLSKNSCETPNWVRDRIKDGCDSIRKANPTLIGKLGAGRINALNAVSVDSEGRGSRADARQRSLSVLRRSVGE